MNENEWIPQETPALLRDLEQIMHLATLVVNLKLEQIQGQAAEVEALLGDSEAFT